MDLAHQFPRNRIDLDFALRWDIAEGDAARFSPRLTGPRSGIGPVRSPRHRKNKTVRGAAVRSTHQSEDGKAGDGRRNGLNGGGIPAGRYLDPQKMSFIQRP